MCFSDVKESPLGSGIRMIVAALIAVQEGNRERVRGLIVRCQEFRAVSDDKFPLHHNACRKVNILPRLEDPRSKEGPVILIVPKVMPHLNDFDQRTPVSFK